MAASEQGKILSDLLVIELRTILKQRRLNPIGSKTALVERLHRALISEGKDPVNYIFTSECSDSKMEIPKEQIGELNAANSDEMSKQSEIDTTVLDFEVTPDESKLEETPDVVNGIAESSSFHSENVDKKDIEVDENMDHESIINDSFVLMIDELISETFLEETQHDNVEENSNSVGTDDAKQNDIQIKKADPISSDDGPNDGSPDAPKPLNPEEDKKNEDLSLSNLPENEDIQAKPRELNGQENICNKELIVVINRENFLESGGKLISKQLQNDDEKLLLPVIKIKEEIIVLSDDEMNIDLNEFKVMPTNEHSNNKLVEPNIQQPPAEEEEEEEAAAEEDTTSDPKEKVDILATTESSSVIVAPVDEDNKTCMWNLKIENLVLSIKAQELRQLLCEYTKVFEVKVFCDNKKTSCNAFARVEAKYLDDIIEKLNTVDFKGKVLSVTRVDEKKKASADNKEMESVKDLQKKKLETDEKNESRDVDRNLWVTNLLQSTKAQDIKQLLSKYAKVIGVKVVKNSSDPSKNCYGYVTLESKAAVDLCIKKLDRITFYGRTIRLSATKKTPILDNIQDKIAKRSSPDKEAKESNTKCSDKKKTPEKSTKKVDDAKREDDKKTSEYNKKDFYEINRSERERNQIEKERIRREDERIRQEKEHAREIARRQREEARLLERERAKIRIEREYLERQRSEFMRLERERQRIERERIDKEKEELRRQQQQLDEARRADKRRSTSATVVASKRFAPERPYNEVSPKRDVPKSKKPESRDFLKLSAGFSSKRSSDYSKTNDGNTFSKRHSDYTKRSSDYSKRSSDYHKRSGDFPKRFDHYAKTADVYAKENYHRSSEFQSRSVEYKRPDDRNVGVDFKRDYTGHSSHHLPSTISAANSHKYEPLTYHQDREKLLRNSSRKEIIPLKDSKTIGYNDRGEITNTAAYRSIVRDDRERDRKPVDYAYKNDGRLPLVKEAPRFKDDATTWQPSTVPAKNFRDAGDNPNGLKEAWWRKSWDDQWKLGNSTEYPGENYNSGSACPPPPGINSYPMGSHFVNYSRKY